MTRRHAEGERFGAAAAQLCHAASVLLGWRPDEFWSATPAELGTALAPPADASASMTIEELKRRFPGEGLHHG
ncbi:MAG: phage tail assembly chaperone [Sphingomicrobium sp.]